MRLSLFSLALIFLLGSPPSLAAAQPRRCGVGVLREGAIPSGRLRLGPPSEFDDGVGINAGRCFPLYDGGRLVTWLNSYHLAKTRLLVRRCVEGTAGAPAVTTGGRPGWVEDGFVELRFDGRGRAQFLKFEPPLWSEFSSPSFCGARVAYWGTESRADGRVGVHAVLFDLGSMRVLRRAFLGHTPLESDSRDFFTPPRWNAGARSVAFDPPAANASNDHQPALKQIVLRPR
jgi:hypothetical protein